MAMTQGQWLNICLQGLGLRSARSPDDVKGASYAMDAGATGMAAFSGPPEGWERKLDGTLSNILGFDNAGGRYLLLVKGVRGTSADYGGTFMKCSSMASGVVAYTEMGSAEVLKDWIFRQIPG